MKPKWQKLASLAQEICTLYFQFFGAVFASKGYPFKNIFVSKAFDRVWHQGLLFKLRQNDGKLLQFIYLFICII